jgi:hypothetical protein
MRLFTEVMPRPVTVRGRVKEPEIISGRRGVLPVAAEDRTKKIMAIVVSLAVLASALYVVCPESMSAIPRSGHSAPSARF